MGRLDRDSVMAHLLSMEEAVAVLRGTASWTESDLRADTVRLWAVAHGLQLAIQNIIDIAAHLGAALRSGVAAEDYRATILAIGDLGVVDPTFAVRIAPMAGLRNIIVHGYLRLQVERLVEALAHLDDFGTFAGDVRAFIEANPTL